MSGVSPTAWRTPLSRWPSSTRVFEVLLDFAARPVSQVSNAAIAVIAGNEAADSGHSGRGRRAAARGPANRHVVFHNLDQAKAALVAAHRSEVRVVLCTAKGAIRYAGPAYLLDLVRVAVAETASNPRAISAALIDCRGEPALAFAALRAGWHGLIFTDAAMHQREITAAAMQYGATLVMRPARALDLAGSQDPVAACLRWYAR